jgi:tetraacyldisaccharide 4'-kinase
VDEAAFRRLISGEKSGAISTLARGGLSAMSLGYGLAVQARNRKFDRGRRKVFRASVPVVSVGNITTGGTGKTPFVAFLAGWFAERGVPVALLSRGYRALPGAANDEKLVLDRLCPGLVHLQDPDRVSSAKIACEQHDAGAILLDDGFQHRRLARDLDIVLIDATNPWGYDRLLPRGLLREPVSSLARADLVVLTRADLCPPADKAKIVERLSRVRRAEDHLEVVFTPECLINSAGSTAALDSLRGCAVGAFCGIGNPGGFERSLQAAGIEPDWFRSFPDHHHYTPADIEALSAFDGERRSAAVVTTEKDLVKIEKTDLGGAPLWAVRIAAQIVRGRELLEPRLNAILDRCRS